MKRQFRRQPFILLSFSSSKKARKAQETQSYQRFQCIGHTDFNTSGTNGPRSLSWAKAGTHATPAPNCAHNGSHGETGAIRMGVVSLPSIRAARSRISPGRVSERQTLPLLGLGRRRSQRTQRAFGTAMRLCVSLFRGVAAPLGCVIFFCFCQNCGLHTMCSVLSACARRGVVSPLLVCSACCRNSRSPLVKTTNLSFSEVGWASLIPAAQNVLDR